MWALMNWRLWLFVGLLSLGPIGYMKGRHDGTKAVRAEWAVAVAQANAEARQMEQKRQANVDQAAKAGAARKAVVVAASAHVGTELDGLRNARDAAERAAQESTAAATHYRLTCGKLLVESGELLKEIAGSADGHVNDIRLLTEAWPK